jgi:hypothetical protein
LRLLHLARVFFSDMDLEVLGRACPNIDDLRLTNISISWNEWDVEAIDMAEPDRRAKDELSMEVILKCWPRMRVLKLDGNRVRMFSAATRRNLRVPVSRSALSAPWLSSQPAIMDILGVAPTATMVTPAIAGLLPRGSYKISSLSLYQTSLAENDLAILVDLVEPTLTYLNIDRNPLLTDEVVRYILMTCSNLRDLSAAELQLTMNIFEDKGPFEPQQQEVQDVLGGVQGLELGESSSPVSLATKKLGPAIKKPWACIKTLRSLDFSWRMCDGQPVHMYTAGSFATDFESFLPSYRHHNHIHHQQRPHDSSRRHSAGEMEDPKSLRMFLTHWHIESIYERLGSLERLEVLQLGGWMIPWRAADIEAFLGHSSEPELVSRENQFQEDKINSYLPWEQYKSMGRWKEAASLKEYKEADFAYIASADSIVKEKLAFQAPNKNTSLPWNASPGVGDLMVDRAHLLPSPTSRMNRLRILNIMCKKPILLDNPVGHASPFVLCPTSPAEDNSTSGRNDRELASGTSTSLAPIEQGTDEASVSPPPPPPPPPPPLRGIPVPQSSGVNPLSTVAPGAAPSVLPVAYPKPLPLRRRELRNIIPLTHGIVASFMKACPNLERVMIAYADYSYVPHQQTDFTIQLGCSEMQDGLEGQLVGNGKENTAAILNDPAAPILRVSPRRVLCTRRPISEPAPLRHF